VKSGQFVVGMLNGTIESYESKNISLLLPSDEMDKLWRLAETRGKGTYDYINYDERVIARSTITESNNDEVGRKGKINHTIIIRFDKSIMHEGNRYMFDTENFSIQDHVSLLTVPLPEKLKNPLPTPEVKT
jgi:hypothetical protein